MTVGALLTAHTSRSTIGRPETIESLLAITAGVAAGGRLTAAGPLDAIDVEAATPPAWCVRWEAEHAAATLAVRYHGLWLDVVTVTDEFARRSDDAVDVVARHLLRFAVGHR